jgi:hypothetical protein
MSKHIAEQFEFKMVGGVAPVLIPIEEQEQEQEQEEERWCPGSAWGKSRRDPSFNDDHDFHHGKCRQCGLEIEPLYPL